MQMNIRPATGEDINDLSLLYHNTITFVNAKDYSPSQTQAWASTSARKSALLKRVDTQVFLVAVSDDQQLIGFITYDPVGYLDMLYVDKDFQRKGVAQKLWDNIKERAVNDGIKKITTDASITALPFFKRQGFELVKEQQVEINGIALKNYKMIWTYGGI
jgi:putative acetyltransferase